MLVLARRQGENLRIGNDTTITVLNIDTDQIKLSVNDSESIGVI
jgi:carbon storage regulator CsrA